MELQLGEQSRVTDEIREIARALWAMSSLK